MSLEVRSGLNFMWFHVHGLLAQAYLSHVVIAKYLVIFLFGDQKNLC